MVSGTKAATLPMLVPTKALVSGIIETINIKKGKDLTIFTKVLMPVYTNLFGLNPFSLDRYIHTDKTIAMAIDNIEAITTMKIVSIND